MTSDIVQLRGADAHCRRLLRHYENFTVRSMLAPRAMRRDLVRVYAFCRTTDDLGDESDDTRLASNLLHAWRDSVVAMFDGARMSHPVLVALRDTVARNALRREPFLELIEANLQDQRVREYEDWPALLDYCALSAAPVGRIVLRLARADTPRAIALSDDVCIGLQLANFAQDVKRDAAIGRRYLPVTDRQRLGEDGAVRAMCLRAATLLRSGRELEALTPGRLRFQLALYRLGGEAILDAIRRSGYQTARERVIVRRWARMTILLRALRVASAVPRVPTLQGVQHG